MSRMNELRAVEFAEPFPAHCSLCFTLMPHINSQSGRYKEYSVNADGILTYKRPSLEALSTQQCSFKLLEPLLVARTLVK